MPPPVATAIARFALVLVGHCLPAENDVLSMPSPVQSLIVASGVLALHAAALWALQDGSVRGQVQTVVPVQLLIHRVETPRLASSENPAPPKSPRSVDPAAVPRKVAVTATAPQAGKALPTPATPVMAAAAGQTPEVPVAATESGSGVKRSLLPDRVPATITRVAPAPAPVAIAATAPVADPPEFPPAVPAVPASPVVPAVPAATTAGAAPAAIASATTRKAADSGGDAAHVTTAANAAGLRGPSAGPAAMPTALAASSQAPLRIDLPFGDAQYLQNPKPPYPPISKLLGEQGKVLINVLVGDDGRAKDAKIHASSGFERLDDAALAVVRKWRFVPGMRAGIPESMWHVVPITFKFN